MADVKVGQVRREKPRDGVLYTEAPFTVRAVYGGLAVCHGTDQRRGVDAWTADAVALAEDAPLWPSEHEQYKDARGYEVKQ